MPAETRAWRTGTSGPPGTAGAEYPGARHPRAEYPGTAHARAEQAGTAHARAEQAGTAHARAEQAGAGHPRPGQPGAAGVRAADGGTGTAGAWHVPAVRVTRGPRAAAAQETWGAASAVPAGVPAGGAQPGSTATGSVADGEPGRGAEEVRHCDRGDPCGPGQPAAVRGWGECGVDEAVKPESCAKKDKEDAEQQHGRSLAVDDAGPCRDRSSYSPGALPACRPAATGFAPG